MYERQYTTTRDRSLDEDVEFFVASDGELKVARGYTFYAEVFGCVAWISIEKGL